MDSAATQALIFDFGGVFTHSEVSQARLREYDALLQLPPDTLHAALYSGEAWELASTGRISPDVYWRLAGQSYEERLPSGFRAYRHGPFWSEPLDEAMVDLALRLHRHYRLALCSNALPELEEILAGRPDLSALFDVRIISVRAGLRKPDPAIFRLTADRLGVPVQNCLLIDDKIRNTVAAAAVGMPAIVFVSVQQLVAELARRNLLPGA